MPLENLTGESFIPDLNAQWPTGLDIPDAGDDHIRGIKNVLQRQFPNIGRDAVTRTALSLSAGSVPAGSRLAFYNAAAPTGWTRVTGLADSSMIRIVASANDGGVAGGTDNPILNDKVPLHQHLVSIQSGDNAGSHQHGVSLTTSPNGAHSHASGLYQSAQAVPSVGGYAGSIETYGAAINTAAVAAHQHAISGLSATENAAHTHSVNGMTNANASGANWVPRYMDFILCERSAT